MSARFTPVAVAIGAALAAAAAPSPSSAQQGIQVPEGVEIVSVTGARRREEAAQDVPIPISSISGDLLVDTGAFNVGRLQNIVPTVQFYMTNPRNTFVNIRGLGQPYGLTNDGIEPGVGFYVDGVLHARPASTTFDFVDVERIEVLRGPQGTLFGKNTTAGAILVTTRKPSFETGLDFELSYGDDNYTQAKASITGPLGEKVAGRLSFSATQRDGNIFNVTSQSYVNDLNNTGVRGQLLFTPSDDTDILLAVDYNRQRPEGYAQVLAGAVPTLRAPERQFWQIMEDLNYVPPNADPATRTIRPFDRVIDTRTPWRSSNEVGGISVNLDKDVAGGTLTVTTAWRYWDWDPSNDRDYLWLDVAPLSQAPSKHKQLSQEVRWAGDFSDKVSAVFGFYAFDQQLNTNPVHSESVGADYWRFVWQPPTATAPNGTPDPTLYGPGGSIVDNYYAGQESAITSQLDTVSAALFTQFDITIGERLHVIPGLRYNYDKKEVDWRQEALNIPVIPPGSPNPPSPAYRNAQAIVEDDDTNVSGQVTVAFDASDRLNYYATFATAFKSIGVNLGPPPATGVIEIPPEDVTHIELGLKSTLGPGTTVNLSLFDTQIEDFQTQALVPGNNRPVIASADKVRVRGAELDANARIGTAFSLYGALAYADAKYVSFPNAPPPLELTGLPVPPGASAASVDASGGRMPGISKWAASFGGEHRARVSFLGSPGELFTGFDWFWRDDFSSSATPSQYLNIDAYSLLNFRVGFRSDDNWSAYLWVRNALDEEYFELLQAAPAGQGAGHYGAQLGDPRTYGLTFRYQF
ncbi:MAG TPA: TonB-dependent receptor [Gammaproteobacteria bacterium]